MQKQGDYFFVAFIFIQKQININNQMIDNIQFITNLDISTTKQYSKIIIFLPFILQFYNNLQMQFKKEYRWLMFLLIPFVIFMFFLFMMPLQIVLNAQPLATKTYTLQKNVEQQNTIRSTGKLLAQKAGFSLEKANILFDLMKLDGNGEEFIQSNVNMAQINNAYQFYISNNGTNKIQMKSMYFLNGPLNSINSDLQQIFHEYLRNQPYLSDYINNSYKIKDSVVGIQNFYTYNGSAVMFYYPSFRDNQYSQSNATVNLTLFQKVLTNYANSNNSYMIFSGINKSNFYSNLTTICNILFSADSAPKGVSCIDLSMSVFTNYMQSDLNFLNGNSFKSNAYLVTPNYRNLSQVSVSASSVSQYSLNVSILTIINNFFDLTPKVYFNLEPSFTALRYGQTILYLFPVLFSQPISNQRSIIAYYLFYNDFQTLNIDLQQSQIVTSTLNTLLIPTITLICLSLIASIFILRSLLNGLDEELHRLNERCKFIFDGDINIEIPSFTGTKDILQVYEEVRIINKLHRYTSKDYFVGHFSNRILKYNEALEVLKSLNYDHSALLQNIGEAYIYIEEFQKSISFLKESVQMILQNINRDHGGLEKMYIAKMEKQKISMSYREKELILIRRLFKLTFTYFKYVELQIVNLNKIDNQNLSEDQKKKKKEKLQQQANECIIKLKKAFYPDFKCYAECVMLLLFQTKFHLSCKNIQEANQCIAFTNKITQAYSRQYDQTTKKLKEKGSKNLFFFKRNKLTAHSRAMPNLMEAFYLYIKTVCILSDPKQKDYNNAIWGLCQALKKSAMSHTVNFLLINQIKKLLTGLKISLEPFQSTQLFRQSMPYKMLHYGPITKQIEPTLYRAAKNPSEVECRQYVFILDTSYYYSTDLELSNQLSYLKQKSLYMYDKLIKKFDRLSLVRSNSETGIETMCNLTLKESNEVILKKSLIDMINCKSFVGRNEVLYTLEKVIQRVKNLKCEKVIVVLLKYIETYKDELVYKGKSKVRYNKKQTSPLKLNLEEITKKKSGIMEEFGFGIEQLMSTQGLRNCKLLLVCACSDDESKLNSYFGLNDINRRIWSRTNGLNINNNVVYLIDQKHKSDIDRILMSKLYNMADNHVFAL